MYLVVVCGLAYVMIERHKCVAYDRRLMPAYLRMTVRGGAICSRLDLINRCQEDELISIRTDRKQHHRTTRASIYF